MPFTFIMQRLKIEFVFGIRAGYRLNSKFDMAQSTDLVESTEPKLHAGLQTLPNEEFPLQINFSIFCFQVIFSFLSIAMSIQLVCRFDSEILAPN